MRTAAVRAAPRKNQWVDAGARLVTWDATGAPRQSTAGLQHQAHSTLMTALKGQAPADVQVLSRRRKAHKRQTMIDAKRAKLREQQRLRERRTETDGDGTHAPGAFECLAPFLSALDPPAHRESRAVRPEHELSDSKGRSLREKSSLEARLHELSCARTASLPPPPAEMLASAATTHGTTDPSAALTWSAVAAPTSIAQHKAALEQAAARCTRETVAGEEFDTEGLDTAIFALDRVLGTQKDGAACSEAPEESLVAVDDRGTEPQPEATAAPSVHWETRPPPAAELHARAFSRLHVHSMSIVDESDLVGGLTAAAPPGLPPRKPLRVPNALAPGRSNPKLKASDGAGALGIQNRASKAVLQHPTFS